MPLLEVKNLRVDYARGGHCVRAVRDVSFAVGKGESLGLVGESGSGKSSLARAILRLEPVQGGKILFEGADVAGLKNAALKNYRRKVQMVFQDPFGSLNPRQSVGSAIEEALRVHHLASRDELLVRVGELLKAVGLDPAFAERYPHEFSGGQRQRIGIARCLAVQPELIVADEPVSALDVSVQVQILNLLKELQRELGLSYLFIAHDLAVVGYLCDRVLVMKDGVLVEEGKTDDVFARPQHEYTKMLLRAVPEVRKGLERREAGIV